MKNRVHLLLVSIALFGSTAGIMAAEAAQQEEQYASILDLYADAARFNWERQEYIDHGLCYIYGYNPSSMGYCFTDINSDGVDEMLTGVYADKSPMEPKYGNIYEIYTLSEGVPVRLAEGNERNRYSICEDGTVCYFWTGGAATNGWSYYTLPADSTELSQYLMIGTDAVYYETDNPDACSFKNTTPPFDYSGNEMITYDEVNSIADSYTYQVPSFLSILDYEKNNAATPDILNVDQEYGISLYRDLIDLYSSAEENQWSSQQYQENGLAFIHGAYHLPVGYCFADLNLDGTMELLVSQPGIYEGDPKYGYFSAVYTLVEGSPKLLLQRGEFSGLFICQDGTIGEHGYSGDQAEYWNFYTLPVNGTDLAFRERTGWDTSLYQDESTWYSNDQSLADNAGNVIISRDEAFALIGRYNILNPEFISIESNVTVNEYEEHAPFYGIWCLGTKDEAEADIFAESLRTQGYPAAVYLTTDWSNLNQEPWFVVAASTYTSEEAAYNDLGWVQQAVPDAYVKWAGDYIG